MPECVRKKDTLLIEKRAPTPPPLPLFNPFSKCFGSKEALYNFCKREQHLIFEHNIGLEYALVMLIASAEILAGKRYDFNWPWIKLSAPPHHPSPTNN